MSRLGAQHGVVLVCSNAIHASMFMPVARSLDSHPIPVSFLALDLHYRGGADDRLSGLRGQDVAQMPRLTGPLRGSFYARSTLSIWRDVMAVRTWTRRYLADRAPKVVVVGNDYGLLEKLVLTEALRSGAATVLVQDGVLGERSRPNPDGLRQRAVRGARQALSPLVRRAGYPFLAASDYGRFGATIVCASGDSGRRYFLSVGVEGRTVLITGQPRYDYLLGFRSGASRSNRSVEVAYFSTPFALQGLGSEPQHLQEAMISQLRVALGRVGRQLTVRRHPQEGPPSDPSEPAEILRDVNVAIIGISSVLEEAVLAGVPVIVPGAVVHGSRFEAFLPPRPAFPRFESADEAVDLIEQLEDRGYRGHVLEAQASHMSRELFVDRTCGAAPRVASAILSVASR